MKKFFIRVILIIFFGAISVNAKSEELVIGYGKFNGKKVEMVIYDGSRIALRIANRNFIDEKDLGYLKKEVETLTSSQEPSKIKEYVLIFKGGYPIWAPYSAHFGEKNFRCLLFSERVKVTGNKIYVYGEKTRSSDYYPYSDIAGFSPKSK